MSIFPKDTTGYKDQPLFLGAPVNIARYDEVSYPTLERLTQTLLSFFWRPEEVDLSKDRIDFQGLSEASQHVFTSNIQYQTVMDSVQARGPVQIFGDLASLPEVEVWLTTWAFTETIHSRSYTHIIRNIYNEPGKVFDTILEKPEIIQRAEEVTQQYDRLQDAKMAYRNAPSFVTKQELREALLLALIGVSILEGIRFYVSFCCSFAFAERKQMEGNAKIIKLIARDESIHLVGVRFMIKTLLKDRIYADIFEKNTDTIYGMFDAAAEQEIEWSKYLFSKGPILGLNSAILEDYVKYISNLRMRSLGLTPLYKDKGNPVPWMSTWLGSSNVQVAPQETEISSYKTADLDGTIDSKDLKGLLL